MKKLIVLISLIPALAQAAPAPIIFGPQNKGALLQKGLRFPQSITPSSPASGYDYLYFKSDDKLYKKTSSGSESEIGGSGGSGTVTTISVASANGFAGSVANPTTTPAITLSTSITGVLKGNGTAIIAATAGTDYAPAQGGLYKAYMGNGSSTIHWDVTSATKADFVATGAPALTQTYNFNMGSPALPTGSLPGVTFTAPVTGTVFVQISTASGILVANNGHFYLTDGSGNVLDAATVHETAANAPASVVLSAYFDVTASSSYTFKLMAASPSGAVSLGSSSTMTNLLSVSIGYVK